MEDGLDEIILADDEFFGVPKIGKGACSRGKGGAAARKMLFDRVKVRMVMRIYHVTCAKAIAIIAKRAEEREALERRKILEAYEKSGGASEPGDFGECGKVRGGLFEALRGGAGRGGV